MRFRTSRLTRSLIIAGFATSLVACGSSSDDNEAPVAGDVSAEADVTQEQTTIDLLANSTDPNGDELTVTDVGSAEFGTVSLEGNTAIYTPEGTEFGEDSFTFTISDGDLTSEATVSLDLVGTLSIQGQVIDSPIANATVYILVNGEEFTVEADENGVYELPAKFTSLDNDQVVRITAVGSEEHGQAHVTLSSMLTSVEKLLEKAGDDFTLNRSEMNDVNVTHVTTARDVLTRKAAGDEEITAENVAEFGNAVDPQLLIQMAAVTKLIVDNDAFELPEGYESIEEFLNDDDSYNEFVETASEGGESSPLNQAIDETLEDPDVMPELSADDLYGRYIQVERAPAFLKPDAYNSWSINENGILSYQSTEQDTSRISFSLNGNKLIPDSDSAALSKFVGYVFVGESDFEGRPEAKAAWIEHNGWSSFISTQVETESQTDLVESTVISQTETELVIRNTTNYKQKAVTFEHEGQEYVALPGYESESQNDIRLVDFAAFMDSELTFDLTEQPEWLLPHVPFVQTSLDMAAYKFSSDNTYSLLQSDLYLEQEAGIYTEVDTSGTWELSDDGRHLTMTSGSGDYSVRLTRHRDTADYKSVVAEYIENGEPTVTRLLYGMPMPQESDFSAFEEVASSNLLFNSIVNYRQALYWDENDTLKIRDFMFDFESGGTGEQLYGLCKGESLEFGLICDEPMTVSAESTYDMLWELKENETLGELLSFRWNPNGNTSSLYIRNWLPLSYSEKNIFSVFEWNRYIAMDSEGNEIWNRVIISPRFNHYQLAERPETSNPDAVSMSSAQKSSFEKLDSPEASNFGYTIINPQVERISQSKH
jgi:hypothetical protein